MTNKQLDAEYVDRIGDLCYFPLERKYQKVQLIKMICVYLVMMGLSLFLLLADDFSHRYLVTACLEGGLLLALVINILFLPKAYAYKGFAIREHDITYRSGIIFPSVITVPFCKIQQVGVRQAPIARIFGLYAVDIVNGAQLLAKVTIPGLKEKRANEIKALILERIGHEGK